ncbi:MAG: amino acid ABC transporter permease [Bacillota bacterium]|nr:amino acid ABC transporter permease [Bacillota bacterium]
MSGLGATLKITFFALIIGITLGVVVALVRVTYDKNALSMRKGLGRRLLGIFNWLAKLFLTVFRGVPVVVQLLIWYFVILASARNGVNVAIVAFGINSAAYTAEIMRAGIMSVDAGQNEAGRSLGFNYMQTMRYIILPQAFKNVLPTLCNECIVLLKETAVAGYVAVTDLTKGAYIIQGRTFVAFMPLFAAALIYLAFVMLLSWLFGKLERRLRASDQR